MDISETVEKYKCAVCGSLHFEEHEPMNIPGPKFLLPGYLLGAVKLEGEYEFIWICSTSCLSAYAESESVGTMDGPTGRDGNR